MMPMNPRLREALVQANDPRGLLRLVHLDEQNEALVFDFMRECEPSDILAMAYQLRDWRDEAEREGEGSFKLLLVQFAAQWFSDALVKLHREAIEED